MNLVFIYFMLTMTHVEFEEVNRKSLNLSNLFLDIVLFLFCTVVGPLVEDIWNSMNNTIGGKSKQKLRMYSAVR